MGPPGVRAQAAAGSDVGYPSRAPCASCAASLRSRANPRKVRGPYPEDLAGSPGGGSVRPVSPGYLNSERRWDHLVAVWLTMTAGPGRWA